MYAYIKGTLTSANPVEAIIEAAGVGYRILIPTNAHAKLPAPGDEVLLHTAYIVRENSCTLFGFLTTADRSFFELLTTISGIGPKTALNLMGTLDPAALQEAITQDSPALLAKVPGIGKKTAERLIVELRDKLHILPTDSRPALSPIVRDAMSALLNLGYTQTKAQTAVQTALKTTPSPDLTTLITTALKHL